MSKADDHEERSEKESIPFPADLLEKAPIVSKRITELQDELNQDVFVGLSRDGLFLIALHGDGRPESVSLRLNLPAEEKELFENEIFEALEAVYQSRMERLAEGMESIQRGIGFGPDFKMPF